MQQLQVRENVVGVEKALGAVRRVCRFRDYGGGGGGGGPLTPPFIEGVGTNTFVQEGLTARNNNTSSWANEAISI